MTFVEEQASAVAPTVSGSFVQERSRSALAFLIFNMLPIVQCKLQKINLERHQK